MAVATLSGPERGESIPVRRRVRRENPDAAFHLSNLPPPCGNATGEVECIPPASATDVSAVYFPIMTMVKEPGIGGA